MDNLLGRRIGLWWLVILALRAWEGAIYGYQYGHSWSLWGAECWGFAYDMLLFGSFAGIACLVQPILSKIWLSWLPKLHILLLAAYTLAHLGIIHYFQNQQAPLDIFLYQYPLREMVHTAATTDANYAAFYLIVGLMLAIMSVGWFGLRKIGFSVRYLGFLRGYLYLSFPLWVAFAYFGSWDTLAKNKSAYFYTRSLAYFLDWGSEYSPYTPEDARAFQSLYPQDSFLSLNYPLLRPFAPEDSLSARLHRLDSAPNVVILIMEGLNDDYIHPYHGQMLMPFLSELAQKSLYWERCLTLGERSFAAVPCITGGLPYGIKGFNFLPQIPNHISLVSLLQRQGFSTHFFDGQGSWFHNKDRYFRHNFLSRLMDNSCYPEKYKKIIVKDFFWGYHDRDMFLHSLERIDSLPSQKRLDMYFSGTMHSPFAVDDSALYAQKFAQILAQTTAPAEKAFFQKHSLFIQAVQSTDNALAAYFAEYARKPNYQNTIFIITGDHPMSELPRVNSLKRYHVPLIIYSPKLQKAEKFSQVVSHLDIYETIVGFLVGQGQIIAPQTSTSLGRNLFKKYASPRPFALMNDNREIIDFLLGDMYLSDNQLFEVQDSFKIRKISNPSALQKMQTALAHFRKTNLYVSTQNKLLSDTLYAQSLGFKVQNLPLAKATKDTFSREFYDIYPPIEANEQAGVLDIFLKHAHLPTDDCWLVCEQKDTSGKTLSWDAVPLRAYTSSTQARFALAGGQKKRIGLVLWNKKQTLVQFEQLQGRWFERLE